jgi:hypothetical protein
MVCSRGFTWHEEKGSRNLSRMVQLRRAVRQPMCSLRTPPGTLVKLICLCMCVSVCVYACQDSYLYVGVCAYIQVSLRQPWNNQCVCAPRTVPGTFIRKKPTTFLHMSQVQLSFARRYLLAVFDQDTLFFAVLFAYDMCLMPKYLLQGLI